MNVHSTTARMEKKRSADYWRWDTRPGSSRLSHEWISREAIYFGLLHLPGKLKHRIHIHRQVLGFVKRTLQFRRDHIVFLEPGLGLGAVAGRFHNQQFFGQARDHVRHFFEIYGVLSRRIALYCSLLDVVIELHHLRLAVGFGGAKAYRAKIPRNVRSVVLLEFSFRKYAVVNQPL